jgi:hypothetical protein
MDMFNQHTCCGPRGSFPFCDLRLFKWGISNQDALNSTIQCQIVNLFRTHLNCEPNQIYPQRRSKERVFYIAIRSIDFVVVVNRLFGHNLYSRVSSAQ